MTRRGRSGSTERGKTIFSRFKSPEYIVGPNPRPRRPDSQEETGPDTSSRRSRIQNRVLCLPLSRNRGLSSQVVRNEFFESTERRDEGKSGTILTTRRLWEIGPRTGNSGVEGQWGDWGPSVCRVSKVNIKFRGVRVTKSKGSTQVPPSPNSHSVSFPTESGKTHFIVQWQRQMIPSGCTYISDPPQRKTLRFVLRLVVRSGRKKILGSGETP